MARISPRKDLDELDDVTPKTSKRRWNMDSYHDMSLSAVKVMRLFDRKTIDAEHAKTLGYLINLAMRIHQLEKNDIIDRRLDSIEKVLDISPGLHLVK